MSAMLPMAVYGLEVPPGEMPIPANDMNLPAAFRITMAAIDPSAVPDGDDDEVPRATLKIIRESLDEISDDDEDADEDFDVDEYDRMFLGGSDDDEEDSEDEDANGGPSDPAKSKKARKAAAEKAIKQLLEQDDDMEVDDLTNGVNGAKKSAKALGKMPASDDSEDDEDDDDEEGGEIEEFVVCTLDPTKHYQQTLDITIGEREKVFFMVSGTHSVYLTGNYVEPAGNPESGMYDPDSDDEEDYDLEPDSDELDEDDEEDELDELENPRVTEVDEEDEDEAPELVKAIEKKQEKKKGKNKRPAEDEEDVADAETIDSLIAKESIKAAQANGETKLSKKQAKKLKKNDGTAATVEGAKKEAEEPSSTKSDKKVQFAKQLEQGPTPTKDAKPDKTKTTLGVKVVQGVTIDDKKLGKGPAAKPGDRVGMRYIGKLQKDNSVFDSNKKGKPFTFKLGAGEVIKGWDIGIQGMSAGGERRITIPAHLAYGSKGVPGIPGGSTLVFDVKTVEIHPRK